MKKKKRTVGSCRNNDDMRGSQQKQHNALASTACLRSCVRAIRLHIRNALAGSVRHGCKKSHGAKGLFAALCIDDCCTPCHRRWWRLLQDEWDVCALREQRDDEPRMSLRGSTPHISHSLHHSLRGRCVDPGILCLGRHSVDILVLSSGIDEPLHGRTAHAKLCGRRVVRCRWYHHYLDVYRRLGRWDAEQAACRLDCLDRRGWYPRALCDPSAAICEDEKIVAHGFG